MIFLLGILKPTQPSESILRSFTANSSSVTSLAPLHVLSVAARKNSLLIASTGDFVFAGFALPPFSLILFLIVSSPWLNSLTLHPSPSSLMLLGVATVYTMVSGFYGVVFTDMFQALIIFALGRIYFW